MRVSRLMLVTLRDVPTDAEIASHQLLIRGGYIRRVAAGIYAYMPLMWKVLSKITAIVQDEMNATGSLQTLLPQLHPAELWERSGRWKGYTAGEGIMFNLQDRQGRELGLGPTHEEVMTSIAGEFIRSYRQLPISFYQVQTKFRDEIRPRFGLMRSREFIMKDAYSFHADENDLKKTYNKMSNAYEQIFNRCGIDCVAVEADSGAIGGAASQEFMVTAASGEDLILTSPDGKYAANQEKAVSIPFKAKPLPSREAYLIDTPNQNTIEELCLKQNLPPSQVIKVLAMLAICEDGKEQPLLIVLRGDQELNEVKLINLLTLKMKQAVLNISPINKLNLNSQGLKSLPFGALGPDLKDSLLNGANSWQKNFLRIVDHTAAELHYFVCGANQVNMHRMNMTWNTLGGVKESVDIRKAKAGDSCLHDPTQKLEECRGIEVGHIFQLGRKYSQALQANFTNESGSQENLWMGCYGIGISRLAQAAVEQSHDEGGICWPVAIAPFEVIVVIANIKDPIQKQLGEKLYDQLLSKGIDVLLDDRAERAGVKFKDADLIGIPWRVVAGRDSASEKVEVVERSCRETTLMTRESAIEKLLNVILGNHS